MTLAEISKWIDESVWYDITDIEDTMEGHSATEIYERDDKLYAIDTFNDVPIQKFIKDKEFSITEYAEPREVEMRTRMIEEIRYVNKTAKI